VLPRGGRRGRSIETRFLVVELDIDRLRQSIVEDLRVDLFAAVLAGGNFDVGTKEAAQAGIVRAFLRPVDVSEFRVRSSAQRTIAFDPAIGSRGRPSMSVSSREPSRLQRITRMASRSHNRACRLSYRG